MLLEHLETIPIKNNNSGDLIYFAINLYIVILNIT